MSNKYLDYTGLTNYDRQIKSYVGEQLSNFAVHGGVGAADGSLTSVTPETQDTPETWTHIDNGFTTHFREFLIPYSYADTAVKMCTMFENRFSIDYASATDITYYNMLSKTGQCHTIDMSSGTVAQLKNYPDIWIPAEYIRNEAGTVEPFVPTIILRQNKFNNNLSVMLMRAKITDNTVSECNIDVRLRGNGDLLCSIQPSREFLTNTEWNVFSLGIISFTNIDMGYRAEFDCAPMLSKAWVEDQIAASVTGN